MTNEEANAIAKTTGQESGIEQKQPLTEKPMAQARPQARWPLVIAGLVLALYAAVALGGYVFTGYHTASQVYSPDGRYVASILRGAFWADEVVGIETSGWHPFGIGRDQVSGNPDEDFRVSELKWQDNHTLIVLCSNSGRSHLEQQWHDVKVLFKRVGQAP